MLGKVDKKQAQSFLSFDNSHDGQVLSDWLEAEKDRLQHQLTEESDEIKVRWLQGGIQVLRDFLHKKSQARKFIEKL